MRLLSFCLQFGFALSLATTVAATALALGGTDVGRGGDSIALDFKSLALYDLNLIRSNPAAFEKLLSVDALSRVIASSSLEVQPQVILNGVEKDAANYSNPDRIVISSSRWRELSLNDPRKEALVFHEYLGLLGLDDSDYKISTQLLQLIKTSTARNFDIPLYSCYLIRDPKGIPTYSTAVRVGGKKQSDIAHLESGTFSVQIFFGNWAMGTDVLMTASNQSTQVGMLELPHLTDFPPTIDFYSAGIDRVFWEVHCTK